MHGTGTGTESLNCLVASKMARLVEQLYPYCIAIVVASTCAWWDPTPPKTTPTLLGAIINVSGIAIGFLAAAEAIILSIDDVRVIRHLKQAGGYTILVRYLSEAIIASFLLAAVSAVGLFRDFETGHWHWFGEAAWVFLLVAASLSYFRVLWVFFKILNSTTIQKKADSN